MEGRQNTLQFAADVAAQLQTRHMTHDTFSSLQGNVTNEL